MGVTFTLGVIGFIGVIILILYLSGVFDDKKNCSKDDIIPYDDVLEKYQEKYSQPGHTSSL